MRSLQQTVTGPGLAFLLLLLAALLEVSGDAFSRRAYIELPGAFAGYFLPLVR